MKTEILMSCSTWQIPPDLKACNPTRQNCSENPQGSQPPKKLIYFSDVLLTVHLSITLVNDQLDAQIFYIIIRLLQSSTCFEQSRAHHQDVKFY